ncbi:MAG: lytic transglycosylase domain-containing protein, partial [Sulfitobacter sp.]|nr:lytic transglycosylase domain-containing protein [Sulfitobacter sp.]
MTRILATLLALLTLASAAAAERPRPLGWAMESLRSTGDWAGAARLAARDGEVAADIIEWQRLRAGLGSYAEVITFLERRPNWPGESYLRHQAEEAVIKEGDAAVLAFFQQQGPQTAEGILAHAKALTEAGRAEEAETMLIAAWQEQDLGESGQALFLAAHETLLEPHNAARLDAMLWQRELGAARRMLDLVDKDQRALALTRIALQRLQGDVNAMIDDLPESLLDAPGLAHDRFEWRIRKGFGDSATELLEARSTSAEALGVPEAWANRRRALARQAMRAGEVQQAYRLASQHFLTDGSHYADLEWLSGYLALRFRDDPQAAYRHFLNHDSAVQSPISQGRAGYWQGRALEEMGDPEAASVAYGKGAQFQTAVYGLLAA